MKRLKGTMVIELTDEVTGEVETITEENMVTNAVNNILGQNPMGVFYNAAGEYDDRVEWNGALLPICPNMIGGILLLPNILEEKADNMYPASGNLPVAYASNDVNSTSNTARGSLNQTESKALDNGYKFVWEFTPSQGNGTISAVALTSKQGGQNAFGSLVGDASPFLLIRRCDIGGLTDAQKVVLFDGVEIDFNKGILYSLNYEGSVVDIRQVRVPVFDIGLNETLDNSTYKLMKEDTITPTTFNFMDDITYMGHFWTGMMGTGTALPTSKIPLGVQKCFGSRSRRMTSASRRVNGRFPMRSSWASASSSWNPTRSERCGAVSGVVIFTSWRTTRRESTRSTYPIPRM